MASEPIVELAELSEEPSDGFEERVQRSIQRRSFAGDLLGYLWMAPIRIVLEYLGLALSLGADSNRERHGDE